MNLQKRWEFLKKIKTQSPNQKIKIRIDIVEKLRKEQQLNLLFVVRTSSFGISEPQYLFLDNMFRKPFILHTGLAVFYR